MLVLPTLEYQPDSINVEVEVGDGEKEVDRAVTGGIRCVDCFAESVDAATGSVSSCRAWELQPQLAQLERRFAYCEVELVVGS